MPGVENVDGAQLDEIYREVSGQKEENQEPQKKQEKQETQETQVPAPTPAPPSSYNAGPRGGMFAAMNSIPIDLGTPINKPVLPQKSTDTRLSSLDNFLKALEKPFDKLDNFDDRGYNQMVKLSSGVNATQV